MERSRGPRNPSTRASTLSVWERLHGTHTESSRRKVREDAPKASTARPETALPPRRNEASPPQKKGPQIKLMLGRTRAQAEGSASPGTNAGTAGDTVTEPTPVRPPPTLTDAAVEFWLRIADLLPTSKDRSSFIASFKRILAQLGGERMVQLVATKAGKGHVRTPDQIRTLLRGPADSKQPLAAKDAEWHETLHRLSIRGLLDAGLDPTEPLILLTGSIGAMQARGTGTARDQAKLFHELLELFPLVNQQVQSFLSLSPDGENSPIEEDVKGKGKDIRRESSSSRSLQEAQWQTQQRWADLLTTVIQESQRADQVSVQLPLEEFRQYIDELKPVSRAIRPLEALIASQPPRQFQPVLSQPQTRPPQGPSAQGDSIFEGHLRQIRQLQAEAAAHQDREFPRPAHTGLAPQDRRRLACALAAQIPYLQAYEQLPDVDATVPSAFFRAFGDLAAVNEVYEELKDLPDVQTLAAEGYSPAHIVWIAAAGPHILTALAQAPAVRDRLGSPHAAALLLAHPGVVHLEVDLVMAVRQMVTFVPAFFRPDSRPEAPTGLPGQSWMKALVSLMRKDGGPAAFAALEENRPALTAAGYPVRDLFEIALAHPRAMQRIVTSQPQWSAAGMTWDEVKNLVTRPPLGEVDMERLELLHALGRAHARSQYPIRDLFQKGVTHPQAVRQLISAEPYFSAYGLKWDGVLELVMDDHDRELSPERIELLKTAVRQAKAPYPALGLYQLGRADPEALRLFLVAQPLFASAEMPWNEVFALLVDDTSTLRHDGLAMLSALEEHAPAFENHGFVAKDIIAIASRGSDESGQRLSLVARDLADLKTRYSNAEIVRAACQWDHRTELKRMRNNVQELWSQDT